MTLTIPPYRDLIRPVSANDKDSVLLDTPSEVKQQHQAVRTETHKYVEYENGERELYDLQADRYELESIHEIADPPLVEDLQAKLDALRDCEGDGCREAEDDPQ